MGLRQRLAALAASSAHVLVVEAPGAWRVRVEVQRALSIRGWREALSPADADALVVCGAPGEQLAEVVERVWEQLPGPRARAGVTRVEDVPAVLDEVAAALTDLIGQREDSGGRSLRPDLGGDEDTDHGGMDHGDMDHGGMDHGDMDHGGMEMEPEGIPLASGAEDRDGLEMDVLQVRLGPVLPAWPAGLVLDCTLAGDVLTAARVQVLPATPDATAASSQQPEGQDELDATVAAARLCDHASDVLALAGWSDGAARARAVRDGLLAGTAGAAEVRAVQHRVDRSRVLRWSLRPLRLPQPLAGDVHARLVSLLDHAAWCLDHAPDRCEPARPELGEVPSLVTGLDLATARLVVAALALDPARQQAEEEAEVGVDA